MLGSQYRITTPTLAIFDHDGHKLPLTIPQGALVEVADGPFEGKDLVKMRWEGKIVLMFPTDILSRGELVESVGG